MTKKEYFEFLKMKNLSDETARTYYLRLQVYFKNKNTLKDKDKSYLNQVKQAVQYYFQAQDEYYNDDTIYLDELHDRAKKRRKNPVKTLKLKKVNLKINLMREKEIRKKLAFRLEQVSGLRVSEIADLEPRDIEFLDNYKIKIVVRHGKGDKKRTVIGFNDKYVWEKLKDLEPRKNGKIFHSASTLMKKAKDLGFKTHKLRKVCPITLNNRYEAWNEFERRKKIHQVLGHEIPKNKKAYDKLYKIYTDENEVNLTGTKFDI